MNFFKKLFDKPSKPRSDDDGGSSDPNVKRYINELNDPHKRSAAVTELGKLKDPAGARAIVEVLLGKQETNPNYVVFVAHGIEALGEIGDPFAVPLLLDILKATLETLRKCAADALGNIGHKAAVPDLRTALMKDKSWAVRASAASALGKLGDPTVMPVLFEATRDENQIVRFEAKDALNKLKSAPP